MRPRPMPTCRISGRRCPAISAGRSSTSNASLPTAGTVLRTPAVMSRPSELRPERQRLAAEEQAARGSSVLVQLSKPAAGATPSQAPLPALALPDAAENAPASSLGAQQHKLDFVRSGDGDINPHGLTGPQSPWTLAAGTLIPASLVTGLNSDLAGMVVAQVTENVRDSATGRTILIPQGARLIGGYDSVVAFGQQRALLVWQRILFPTVRRCVSTTCPRPMPPAMRDSRTRSTSMNGGCSRASRSRACSASGASLATVAVTATSCARCAIPRRRTALAQEIRSSRATSTCSRR